MKETPRILRARTDEEIQKGLERAAGIILAGGAVALPTESFYGLAVNALDGKCVHEGVARSCGLPYTELA